MEPISRVLRSRYGKSIKQQSTTFLRGFQRDGRRPTDMLAFIKDQTSKVTMDSLYKEMVVSSLPSDIQRAMADKLDSLDAQGAANLADAYFDKDGKVLIPSSSINSVDEPSYAPEEEEAEVNAIGGRRKNPPRQQGFKKNQRSFGGKGPLLNGPSATPTTSQQPRQQQQQKPALQSFCQWHIRYGDKAYTCVEGCSQWEKTQQKKGNGRARNRQ